MIHHKKNVLPESLKVARGVPRYKFWQLLPQSLRKFAQKASTYHDCLFVDFLRPPRPIPQQYIKVINRTYFQLFSSYYLVLITSLKAT